MGQPPPTSAAIQAKCTADSLQFNARFGARQDVFDSLVRKLDRIDTSNRS